MDGEEHEFPMALSGEPTGVVVVGNEESTKKKGVEGLGPDRCRFSVRAGLQALIRSVEGCPDDVSEGCRGLCSAANGICEEVLGRRPTAEEEDGFRRSKRPWKTEKTEKTEKIGKIGKIGKTEKPEKTEATAATAATAAKVGQRRNRPTLDVGSLRLLSIASGSPTAQPAPTTRQRPIHMALCIPIASPLERIRLLAKRRRRCMYQYRHRAKVGRHIGQDIFFFSFPAAFLADSFSSVRARAYCSPLRVHAHFFVVKNEALLQETSCGKRDCRLQLTHHVSTETPRRSIRIPGWSARMFR